LVCAPKIDAYLYAYSLLTVIFAVFC